MPVKNEALLTEIRDTFARYVEAWRDIRDEGKKDMDFVSADTWSAAERTERAGRPCMDMDELGQYINQLVNTVRQNPISIKIVPVGDGANDKTAELRQGKIRDIEYESNAKSAYATAFQSAAERSYGYARVISVILDPRSFDHDLRIEIIPNPDTVYLDPDAKQPDCSDGNGAFIIDSIPRSKFKDEYPNAEIKDFTDELVTQFPTWLRDDSVQIAEYWKRKKKKRLLLLYGDAAAPVKAFLDEIEGAKIEGKGKDSILVFNGQQIPILKQRESEQITVCQYITNGVEILKEKEEPEGVQYIPIIPMFGKQYYRDKGSGNKRVLESFIRKARNPQKMFNFACSQEAEEFSKSPNAPYIGYKGQFTDPNWQKPGVFQFLEVEATTDASQGQQLPIPTRMQFTPNFQEYEIAKQSFRQSIQAAIGYYNASIGKHDTNAKSGKAIEKLEGQSDAGSFHFVDNYKRFIEHIGRVLDERLDHYYDGTRETGVRDEDGTYRNVKVNQPEPDEQGEQPQFGIGVHKITISTGPSFDSQREAAIAFGETLMGSPQGPLVADLIIRQQQLGPLGDEMADRLTPPQFAKEGSPEQTKAQMAQMSQQHEALTKIVHQQAQVIETKQVESASKERIVQMQEQTKMTIADKDREAKIEIAQIMSKSQDKQWREELMADIYKQLHGDAHDAASQAAQQAHEKDIQNSQQAAAAQSQDSSQAHEADQSQQAQEAAAAQPAAE